MTVNHSGKLTKEYFISYLTLVMNSKGCTLQQAKDITFHKFFKGNFQMYGEDTYNAFLEAVSILEN
ncbi:hypothetical protein [Rossellomorea aquimaris]|uniref:Uncharacterized protein n=1 Tax=Rossellomorea aquimaris TaxID=189382 RepID=A0A5D4U670_9BACI|nr:hypothetical protein [Rossellomorea aquimaris]TYS82728.1 hypothetical protein FZC80_04100 [Rossellomorea aquimaris]